MVLSCEDSAPAFCSVCAFWRAKGPKPYQPGATPQVESPSHLVASLVTHFVANHVCDATKLIPDPVIRDALDRVFISVGGAIRYLGRCPRLV